MIVFYTLNKPNHVNFPSFYAFVNFHANKPLRICKTPLPFLKMVEKTSILVWDGLQRGIFDIKDALGSVFLLRGGVGRGRAEEIFFEVVRGGAGVNS